MTEDGIKIYCTSALCASSIQNILKMDTIWTIQKDGKINISMSVTKSEGFPELPRFGIRLFLVYFNAIFGHFMCCLISPFYGSVIMGTHPFEFEGPVIICRGTPDIDAHGMNVSDKIRRISGAPTLWHQTVS